MNNGVIKITYENGFVEVFKSQINDIISDEGSSDDSSDDNLDYDYSSDDLDSAILGYSINGGDVIPLNDSETIEIDISSQGRPDSFDIIGYDLGDYASWSIEEEIASDIRSTTYSGLAADRIIWNTPLLDADRYYRVLHNEIQVFIIHTS